MKFYKLFLAAAVVAALASCQSGGLGSASMKSTSDTLSYAFGLYYGANLQANPYLSEDDINFANVARGLKDGFSKDTTDDRMTVEDAVNFLNNYFRNLEEKKNAENLVKGQKFLEENKSKEGVIVDSTGLQYKVITEGTGATPTETDEVKVHYRGTLIDGTPFDSSYDRGEPAQFKLNRVIRGWTIGLQKMKVGSKYMLYIPAHLGYGVNVRQGSPIGPNETLIFEVELLDIIKEKK